MFLPIFPKVPSAGGVRNVATFLDTKQPPAANVAGEAASATQPLTAEVSAAPVRDWLRPYGFTILQATLPATKLEFPVLAVTEQKGRLVFPDVMLEAGPEMFQRSLASPVPLKLFPASHAAHGWEV